MMRRLLGTMLMIAGPALIFVSPRLVLSFWPIQCGFFEGFEPSDEFLVGRFLMTAMIGVIILFAGLQVFRSARYR